MAPISFVRRLTMAACVPRGLAVRAWMQCQLLRPLATNYPKIRGHYDSDCQTVRDYLAWSEAAGAPVVCRTPPNIPHAARTGAELKR